MKQTLKNTTAIVAVISAKGGAGKSTTVTNLAIAAAQKGTTVAVLDLDVQGTLDQWAAQRSEDLVDVTVRKISASNLKAAVSALQEAGVELILIDTPPHSSAVADVAAAVADVVVIPCRPTRFDILGVKATADQLKASKNLGKARLVMSQVPTHIAGLQQAQAGAGAVKKAFGIECIGNVFSRAAYAYSADSGLGVTELYPNSKAADEVKALLSAVKGA